MKTLNNFARLTFSAILMMQITFAVAQNRTSTADGIRPGNVKAQQSGIKRTDLQRHDLSDPAREAIQVRIDFEPGTAFGMHSHPGEEVIYVLEGTLEYEIEDEVPIILKAGGVLFIPSGKNHSARNVGTVKAAELATYIVSKGKPLLVLKK